MLVSVALIVLAVLGYLGNSMVMVTSVAGIAVAGLATKQQQLQRKIIGVFAGAITAGFVAEIVHLLYHLLAADQPDHSGFWMSAFLVGLINAVVIAPVVWFVDFRARKA